MRYESMEGSDKVASFSVYMGGLSLGERQTIERLVHTKKEWERETAYV